MRGLCIVAIALACLASASFGQASFTPLGLLPGGSVAQGTGVSNDGGVVVGSREIVNPDQAQGAWVWRPGVGYQFLAWGAGDTGAGAFGVSGSGLRIAGVTDDPYEPAALAAAWNGSTNTLQVLGDIPGGDDYAVAYGISRDGSTIVGSGSSAFGGSEAFIVGPSGVMTGLGFFPGDSWTEAYGTNADGTVVVGMGYRSVFEWGPMYWDEEIGMIAMELLPGSMGGYAYAVSDDGVVAAGDCLIEDPARQRIFTHGYRWTIAGGTEELGPRPAGFLGSGAYCINQDGSLIGGTLVNESNRASAMLWDAANGCRLLSQVLTDAGLGPQIAGWTLLDVAAMSSDGTWLLGNGDAPSGGPHMPFLVHLPAPPVCSADYNQDGGGDNADVTDLANDIAAGTQSYPPSNPDFNQDGGADNTDVTDLANVVAGGPCP